MRADQHLQVQLDDEVLSVVCPQCRAGLTHVVRLPQMGRPDDGGVLVPCEPSILADRGGL